MKTQTSLHQIQDLSNQITALLRTTGLHGSDDFDSIISQAKILVNFHTIFCDFSLINKKSAEFLNLRINMSLTRQETTVHTDFKFEEIANAEMKLLNFLQASLNKSINSIPYELETESILPPPPKIKPQKPKINFHKTTLVPVDKRAEEIKSLYSKLENKKGGIYASSILKDQEKRVLFDLILKDLPITREHVYANTGCTRTRLLVVMRNLQKRLEDEISH